MTNVLLRLFGFGKAVDALDGETSKTYAAGAQKILTGVAAIAGGVAAIAAQFVAAKGGAEYLQIGQGLLHNPAFGAISAGWVLILDGKATIAQRHAIAKAAASAAPVVAPAASAPQP